MSSRRLWIPLSTLLLFEAAWFACVIGAAKGWATWGIGAVLLSIAWQLALSERRRTDLLLIAVALGMGLVWDSWLMRSGTVVYASPLASLAIAPPWILALWAQLGSVVREPLRWLQSRLWLAVPLSAAGGAASYAGASRLGACTFPDDTRAMIVLAVGWGVLLPLLLTLARRLDRSID